MARPIRLEAEGAVYHVIARGNERRAIFRDDRDREEYLNRLARYRERFGFKLLAYCLMDNHVHLAVERGPVALSRVIHSLHGPYTQWFNVRHGRVGHLFQGRYKALLVEKDRYLLALVRYIHENPVKARLVQRPQEYPWSSDRYYRRASGPAWLDLDAVLVQFGRGRVTAARKYRRFMGEPTESPYEQVETHGGTVKGEEEFAETTFRTAGEFIPKRRGISIARIAAVVARDHEVDANALGRPGRYRGYSQLRALTALVARDIAGHSVASVARHFHREESTLVRQVLNLEREIANNPRRRAAIATLVDTVRNV
jgi:REP element-mobilizing transposase RayT